MSVRAIEPSLEHSDFFGSESLLRDEERQIRERVARFNTEHAAAGAADRWVDGRFGTELVPALAELGVIGGGIQGYGCAGSGEVGEGLVAAELAKVDVGLSAFFGIQSSLAMRAIAGLGSPRQREQWLPSMASLENIGALGITEPEHGSDISGMTTSARRDGDEWVLHGGKKWVGNASIADVVVIFARDEQGAIAAFLVPGGIRGFRAEVIQGKVAFRSSWQTLITLDGVRIPAENRLDGADDGRQAAVVLNGVRPIAAWQALGVSIGAYESVLAYLSQREQFGKPLTAFQLVQEKLADMAVEISTMRLICIRVSRMLEEGTMTDVHAAAAKRHCARACRGIVATARDLMGGNGLLAEHTVGRHFADAEAIFTYDGTDHIQSLLLGRRITGISALR